ncbi:hypothetical protein [Actinomadura sp. 6N118]|uniref:hypothetical protein n=1 Tax=Actinomadura sp. 6N118 TaxID=3375151 RepID=UPI00379E4905
MRETLLTLWNLTPVRLAIRLANTGLNLVTTRELITALTRADLGLTLIAIAWLIPWEKVALLAYRLIRTAGKEHKQSITVGDQDEPTPPAGQDRPDARAHARPAEGHPGDRRFRFRRVSVSSMSRAPDGPPARSTGWSRTKVSTAER